MKKLFLLTLFFSFCILFGCRIFDVEKAQSRKIIGNIYLVNLNIPEDSGFYLIVRKKPSPDHYILKDFEYVTYLNGNDSILLVKTRVNDEIEYHLINHDKGDSVIKIEDLTESSFLNYQHFIKSDFHFDANAN